jgi:hypothetical protein
VGRPVNLIRPSDGEVVTVDESKVESLARLGYRPQEVGEQLERAEGRAEKEYYSSGEQQFITGVEGALSGLTIGASDMFADAEAGQRARYNPGTRIATEIGGAILPAIFSGGTTAGASGARAAGSLASLARITPAGQLAYRAGNLGKAVGGGLKGAVVAAGVEGAVFGGGAEVTRTALSGDPLTVEGVIASAGIGGILGAGAGALAHGFGALGARAKQAITAADSAAVADDATKILQSTSKKEMVREVQKSLVSDESFDSLRVALRDMKRAADDTLRAADDAVKAATAAPKAGKASLKQRFEFELRPVGDQMFGDATLAGTREHRAALTRVRNAYTNVKAAWKDPQALDEAVEAYRAALVEANEKMGGGYAIPSLIRQQTDTAAAAVRETADYAAVYDAVSRFPDSPDAFFKMKSQKADEMFAAVDKVMALRDAGLRPTQQALEKSIDDIAARAGIAVEGTPAERLKAVYGLGTPKALKEQFKAAKQAVAAGAEPPQSQVTKVMRRSATQGAARQASAMVRKVGGNAFLGAAAYQVGGALMGGVLLGGDSGGFLGGYMLGAGAAGRGAVVSKLTRIAATWGPRAERATRAIGPRVEPLAWSMSGIKDDESNRKELFKKRSQEIRELAVAGPDRAFAAAAAFEQEGHGDFAKVMHQKVVGALQHTVAVLPKDPGKTPWGLESLWEPTPGQLEVFSRAYRAVTSPMESFETLASGDVHPAEVKALQAAWPELYGTWRAAMIERLASDDIQDRLTRQDLSDLSVALDMPLASTQRPEWISAQQQMFLERSAPVSPPNQSGPVGRPPGPGNDMTAAQRLTER